MKRPASYTTLRDAAAERWMRNVVLIGNYYLSNHNGRDSEWQSMAISEFAIQPGRRDEFVRLFESLVAQHFEDMRAAGCHSSTLYVVVDDPDKAVEISDWDSAEARERMGQSEAMGAFAPLFELVAAPPSATVGRAVALDRHGNPPWRSPNEPGSRLRRAALGARRPGVLLRSSRRDNGARRVTRRPQLDAESGESIKRCDPRATYDTPWAAIAEAAPCVHRGGRPGHARAGSTRSNQPRGRHLRVGGRASRCSSAPRPRAPQCPRARRRSRARTSSPACGSRAAAGSHRSVSASGRYPWRRQRPRSTRVRPESGLKRWVLWR